jgi:D-alanyl-D-alanine carboxypeptidase
MLLSHRSGLPRYVLKPEFWAKLREDPDRTFRPEERVAYVLDDAPVHEAGKGWAYSDTNYILVGMILEKVSGASYGSELERRILKPCALASTEPSVRRSLAGLAVGHTGDRKAPFLLPARVVEEGRYAINPQFEWTGGGLVTTARDLARWAYLLYGGAVLGQAELDAMLEAGETGAGFRYGLGAMLWESDHGPLVGHAGIMPGYESIVVYSRRGEFSLALQINADSTSGKLDRPMIVYVRELLPDVVRYLASTPGAVPR